MVGVILAMLVLMGIVTYLVNEMAYAAGRKQGNREGWAERDALKLPPNPDAMAREQAAVIRSAATATRATIGDELSKLEPLHCGRGPGHFRASDVRRIVTGEPNG
jgi:hypothetical protein